MQDIKLPLSKGTMDDISQEEVSIMADGGCGLWTTEPGMGDEGGQGGQVRERRMVGEGGEKEGCRGDEAGWGCEDRWGER